PQAQQKPLAAILAEPAAESPCFCFGEPLAASNPIVQAVKAHGVYLPFEELSGAALSAWVSKELQNAGIAQATSEIAQSLIEIGEGSPDRIAQRVEHLAIYLDGAPVTVA